MLLVSLGIDSDFLPAYLQGLTQGHIITPTLLVHRHRRRL
jgi:hypothetical protein